MIATQPNILTWPRRISKSRIRVHLTIPGEPISKQRPRFSVNKNGRVYTPRQTRESEEWIGWQIKNAYQGLMPDADYAFGVRTLFYQSNQQRRDLDNMTKLILDACTGVVWVDDSQVTEIIAHVFRGDDKPRTELCIYSLDYIIHMTSTCAACGKQFRSYPSWQKQNKIYCSRTCQIAATRSGLFKTCTHCGKEIYRAPHRLRAREFYCSLECLHAHKTVELQCEYCKQTFRRPRSLNKHGRKFCSNACQAAFWREHRAKQAKGICIDCGNSTSKKTYKRCAACYIASKQSKTPLIQ